MIETLDCNYLKYHIFVFKDIANNQIESLIEYILHVISSVQNVHVYADSADYAVFGVYTFVAIQMATNERNRVFLKAKFTKYTLRLLTGFLCQKKSFSFSELWLARTFSRASSSLRKYLSSRMLLTLSSIPVVIVRTFQCKNGNLYV